MSSGMHLPREALVVFAHPSTSSPTAALAHAAADGFRQAGLQVRTVDLHGDGFDPVMTEPEAAGRRAADPLIDDHIAALRHADALAVVHPNCWGAPPAMMKGWMDRIFAPGADYEFTKGDDDGGPPAPLLKLRKAIVVNTSNTTEERERDRFGIP